MGTDAIAVLEQVAEGRHRDPAEVLRLGEATLVGHPDEQTGAVARWVIGLALHELGRFDEAIDALRRAADGGASVGPVGHEGRARAALAVSLLSAGHAEEAGEQIAKARAGASGASQGYVEMVAALLRQRNGELGEAQAAYGRALRLLQHADDRPSIARLLLNRGALRAYRGDFAGAIDDLLEAEGLAAELQLPVLAAMAAHNLGFAYGRRSDLPRALTAFGRAEAGYALGTNSASRVAVLHADLCEVLLEGGLVPEARRAAERAMAAVAPTGDTTYLSECRLLHARALLADGTWSAAAVQATEAGAEFAAAGRLAWAALADYVAIQAEVTASEDRSVPPPGLLQRCQDVARLLELRGWRIEAGHVRTYIGRIALALGRPEIARAELALEPGTQRRGTTDQRAQAFLSKALLHLSDGRRRAAKRALSDGLRLVEQHVTSLGSTELRARAASHSVDLARLGLVLARDDGRPAEVLKWAERCRANSLRRPPVASDDPAVLDALGELRRLRARIQEETLDGAPTEGLRREVAGREEALRRRLHETPGAAVGVRWPTLATLHRALRGRVLVEYVGIEGRLHAVTVVRGSTRLVDVGALDGVGEELAHLTFAVRRSVRMPGGADAFVAACARRLGALLVDPLDLPDGSPAVVVPTGALHGLAWGQLPGLAGRDLTVAPSALLWAEDWSTRPQEGATRATLIAGPGLPGAQQEVERIAALYPGATVLAGADATAPAVLAGLGRSDVVHVAAHASFRADSPLFSSFLLSDGPLTVYDIERAPRVPDTVILAACHAALTRVSAGDELLGTAGTLLAMGVRAIVASVEAVPDEATAPFMVALHDHLRGGVAPSAALQLLRAGAHAAVARTFVCIGRSTGPQQRRQQ